MHKHEAQPLSDGQAQLHLEPFVILKSDTKPTNIIKYIVEFVRFNWD